jgi:RNA polymerase sigma-70 factor, ECF subfamily
LACGARITWHAAQKKIGTTTVHPSAQNTEIELKDLLIKALGGSDVSYNQFLQKMSVCMRAYFRKRLQRDPSEVEDLVQEVLIALHNQRHTFDAAYPVTAWAHGIARYKVIDHYRRRNKAEHIDIDDAQELLVSEDHEVEDARRDLSTLLEELPPKQRQAIVMVKVEGLSIAEASSASGQSESLVKVNIHRGLKKLAELMRSSAP